MAQPKNKSRRTPAKKSSTIIHRWRLRRTHLVVLAVAVAAAAGIMLAPDSAPFSLAKLTGQGTDRVAPKLDTISGNYSVAGEAASTSLLVRYKANVSEQTRNNVNKELGANNRRRLAPLGVDVVQVTSTESVGDIMSRYKARAEVEYIEPNYLAKQFLDPNDNLFPKQWHLHKIGAPAAWDHSQGGYGPIAIIDTGILASQTDLSGSVLPGYNFVADNTDTADDNGHGTHVAGIVSASTNNATGVASIGFKGSLLPVKVLDNTGAGTYGDVAAGIIYATDKGARIINLSLGGSSGSRTLEDAVKYALNRGVIVVAAAGNNGNSTAVYPAAYGGVIAVSATDQNDNLAAFSSYGGNVFISAPGVNVISTYSSGGYATLSGTSMAAPTVSGLIGLALATGKVSAATVLDSLKANSDKVGPYAYNGSGWNQYFGYGRINAAKLLGAAAVGQVVAAPSETTTESKPVASNRSNERGGAAAPSLPRGLQFDTTLDGSVDSVDAARGVVVIKVKNSSNNLQLRADNLIDLYIAADTSIKSGRDSLAITGLTPGSNLNIKAQWKDNRLNAQEIRVTGKPGR